MAKTLKFFLGVFACIVSIYILAAVLCSLLFNIMVFIRNMIPFQGFTAIALLYMISLLSIGLVILASGMFYWITLKMIRISVIAYVTLDFLLVMRRYLYSVYYVKEISEHYRVLPYDSLFKCFCISALGYGFLLVVGLVISEPLYLTGRKIRQKVTEDKSGQKHTDI